MGTNPQFLVDLENDPRNWMVKRPAVARPNIGSPQTAPSLNVPPPSTSAQSANAPRLSTGASLSGSLSLPKQGDVTGASPSGAPFPYTLEDPLDKQRMRLQLPMTTPRPMLSLPATPGAATPPFVAPPGTQSSPPQAPSLGSAPQLNVPTSTPNFGTPPFVAPREQPTAGQPLPQLNAPAQGGGQGAQPSLSPQLTIPDRNDPKYAALQPHGMKRVGLTLAAGFGGPFREMAARALDAPQVAYDRDLENVRTQLGLENTRQQIREHKRTADQPILQDVQKQLSDAMARGDMAEVQRLTPLVEQYEDITDKSRSDATNDFELWQRQNPNAPVADWLDLQNNAKPQKLTNPFEAFAYGTPEEKQAAQDFISFEKKTGRQYDKPSEIEQRYRLFQRDPKAYKAMFGDRGDAQDQSQAMRMLNYIDKRRKEISSDWTLDETEKAKETAELDELAMPYLNAAEPGQSEDRVLVIHPNGTKGTIPRSQLKGAQKKGYQLAQ